jgi:hypothetical protein
MKYIFFTLFILTQLSSKSQPLDICSAIKETVAHLQKGSTDTICIADSMVLWHKTYKRDFFDAMNIKIDKSIVSKAFNLALKDTVGPWPVVCPKLGVLIPISKFDSVILANYRLRDMNRILVDSITKETDRIYSYTKWELIKAGMDSLFRTKVYLEYKAKVLDLNKAVLVFERPVVVDNNYLLLAFHIKNEASHYFSFTRIYKKRKSDWAFIKQKEW